MSTICTPWKKPAPLERSNQCNICFIASLFLTPIIIIMNTVNTQDICIFAVEISKRKKCVGKLRGKMWLGHSVEEILRTLRNVACCFDPHQGIWQSLNWITCFTTTCSLMPWWQVRWAPILWTPSFSTLWNSLMVSMISMARKEISCSWHAWVTPCISHLKAGFNIVIIYLRSITPLHFNNFNII